MKLKWNQAARRNYVSCLRYISEDSLLAAEKVDDRVELKIQSMLLNPTKHPPDRDKIQNDGTYRAFVSDSLRISFRVFKSSIHIIRVRHVKRKPLRY